MTVKAEMLNLLEEGGFALSEYKIGDGAQETLQAFFSTPFYLRVMLPLAEDVARSVDPFALVSFLLSCGDLEFLASYLLCFAEGSLPAILVVERLWAVWGAGCNPSD